MDTGADFQIWLEYTVQPQMAVIRPYVRSPAAGDFRYNIRVRQQSRGSVATISQGGVVHAPASDPVSLTRIAVNPPAGGDTCQVELNVTGPDGQIHTRFYPCDGTEDDATHT